MVFVQGPWRRLVCTIHAEPFRLNRRCRFGNADGLGVRRRTLHLVETTIPSSSRIADLDGDVEGSRRPQPLEAVTRHTAPAHSPRVTTRSPSKRFRRQRRDVRPSPSCDPSARTAVTRQRSLQSLLKHGYCVDSRKSLPSRRATACRRPRTVWRRRLRRLSRHATAYRREPR